MRRYAQGNIVYSVNPKAYVYAEELTQWINECWSQRPGGRYSPAILQWDDYKYHKQAVTLGKFVSHKTKVNAIDGGLTPKAQLLDLLVNRLFKDYLHEMYDLWALQQPLDHRGRIKPPSRQQLSFWVKEAWERVPKAVIVRSALLVGASTLQDYSPEEVKEYRLDTLNINPIIADIVAEGGSGWVQTVSSPPPSDSEHHPVLGDGDGDGEGFNVMRSAVVQALGVDVEDSADSAYVDRLMQFPIYGENTAADATDATALGMEEDDEEIMLGSKGEFSAMHKAYMVNLLIEDNRENEQAFHFTVDDGSASDDYENEPESDLDDVGQGGAGSDGAGADSFLNTEPDAAEEELPPAPSREKTKRKAYSQGQTSLLEQMHGDGAGLKTTAQRKQFAEQIDGLNGARSVSEKDVKNWVDNRAAKRRLKQRREDEAT